MELNDEEKKWRDELEKGLRAFSMNAENKVRIKALTEMRDTAVKLHSSLQKRGHTPIHHAYMLNNRGMKPDNPDFYFHLHPIEDLVKFTYNVHANDDPSDKTIDDDFEFRVFTRRWGHDEIYTIKRTVSGWFLKANTFTGPCDKTCAPLLYETLRHDSILYPNDVGQWFEWLWQQAKDKGLGREQVQKGIEDIANWIKVTETKCMAFVKG